MQNPLDGQPKRQVQGRIIVLEIAGFALAILTCWGTELLDPPFSLTQVAVETLVITALGGFTVHWTLKFIRAIKYLEGFMVICANCKQVKVDGAWVRIERIMGHETDLTISHGICPECAEKLYGTAIAVGGAGNRAAGDAPGA